MGYQVKKELVFPELPDPRLYWKPTSAEITILAKKTRWCKEHRVEAEALLYADPQRRVVRMWKRSGIDHTWVTVMEGDYDLQEAINLMALLINLGEPDYEFVED